MLSVEVPLGRMVRASAAFDEQLNEATSKNDEVSEYVRSLEERVDAEYSGALAAMAQNATPVFNAIVARMQGQRFVPHQGAVPVRDQNGIAGAVGVSGATSDEDEAIARAGAAAYGA